MSSPERKMNGSARERKFLQFSSLLPKVEATQICAMWKGAILRGDETMIRTTTLAALTLALMSATAFAQTVDEPNAPPAQLSNPNSEPPPGVLAPGAAPQTSPQDAQARDLFCRRDAAARTGYVTPGQAASNAQTNGTVGGTLGGAALGAIIGGASGHAGAGAAIGAGAGLLAGTAVGSANAQAAASNVEQNYAAAYYACMGAGPGGVAYAYGPPPPPGAYPPPPAYYGPYPYPYSYPYPYPYYWGPPVIGVGVGFGWHRHWR
jgi:hypothetical protein